MERVTIIAKLESILGIRDYKQAITDKDNVVAFPEDKYLLPRRWMDDQQSCTAEEFIKKQMNADGVHRWAKRTFYLMIVVNSLLLCLIIMRTVFLESENARNTSRQPTRSAPNHQP